MGTGLDAVVGAVNVLVFLFWLYARFTMFWCYYSGYMHTSTLVALSGS